MGTFLEFFGKLLGGFLQLINLKSEPVPLLLQRTMSYIEFFIMNSGEYFLLCIPLILVEKDKDAPAELY